MVRAGVATGEKLALVSVAVVVVSELLSVGLVAAFPLESEDSAVVSLGRSDVSAPVAADELSTDTLGVFVAGVEE